MELKADLIIADRFRLTRPLGEGGMGAVWLAHHIRLEVPCAVKFMHPEVAEQAGVRARFEREAIAAAQLRSPHVVQILDHGVWEGAPYIAMEYLEGEDLEHRLARRGRLSPEETVAIVTQVARALVKAHAAGLVHRDLKPPNLFLVRDDDREIVKVLDFGVAKSTSLTAKGPTRTGAIVGTPYYMSPEQAQGTKAVDLRTDLWALGVVAYQCLTGQLPFASDAFGELVIKIVVDPIPVPSQVATVPPGFDAWFARALERDPAARFQGAKEMADALAVALAVRAGGTMVAGPIESVGTHALEARATPPDREAAPAGTPAGEVSVSVSSPGAPEGQAEGHAEAPRASTGGRASRSPHAAGAAEAPGRSRPLVVVVVGVVALAIAGAFFALRGGAGAAREAGPPPVGHPVARDETPPPPPTIAPAPPERPAAAPTVEPGPAAPASAAPPVISAAPPASVTGAKHVAAPPAASVKPKRDIGF